MAFANSEDTIVVTNIPSAGKIPFSFICEILYSAINKADILPVYSIYFPVFVSFANIPNLSASGSVAKTTSLSTFCANSNASLKAFLSSGFG